MTPISNFLAIVAGLVAAKEFQTLKDFLKAFFLLATTPTMTITPGQPKDKT